MRKIHIFILILICTLSSVSFADMQSPDKHRIMTFNIRYGSAGDNVNSWIFRKGLALTVIRDFNPDIIGTQEAHNNQLDFLLDKFPHYDSFGAGRINQQPAEDNWILFRKDKYKLIDSGIFWLSETPDFKSKSWDSSLDRNCTWVMLECRNTGESFYVYNMHFDHTGKIAHEESAKLVLEFIEQKGNSDLKADYDGFQMRPYPVILMGDMNAGEDSKAIQQLKSSLNDTFRIVNPSATKVGTFNSFKGKTNGAKIDYIFTDERFEVLEAEIIRYHRGFIYPSDHFPVVAVVGLK